MENHIAPMFGGPQNAAPCTRGIDHLSQVTAYHHSHPSTGNTVVLANSYLCSSLGRGVNARVGTGRIEPDLNYFAPGDSRSSLLTSAPLGGEAAFRDARHFSLRSLHKAFHPVPARKVAIKLSSFSRQAGIPAAPGTAHISVIKPFFLDFSSIFAVAESIRTVFERGSRLHSRRAKLAETIRPSFELFRATRRPLLCFALAASVLRPRKGTILRIPGGQHERRANSNNIR
jgi:hypothetical protein